MKIEKVDIDIITWDEVKILLSGDRLLRDWAIDYKFITRLENNREVVRGLVKYEDGEAISFCSSKDGSDYVVVNNISHTIDTMTAEEIEKVYGLKINKDGIS